MVIPPTSDDPIQRHVFQPLVNGLGIRTRQAAAQTADVFMIMGTSLAAVRAVTADWTQTPGLAWTLAMSIMGTIVMWSAMRASANAGHTMVMGPLGTLHLGVRLLLTYCVVADIIQVAGLLSTDQSVTSASLFRALMQLCQSIAGYASVYLAICVDPPPPPERGRPVPA